MIKKINLCLLIVFIANSCIEPYELNIEGYRNLLVVDGLITNENKSHEVIISRSVSNMNEEKTMVSGAIVKISDDLGNIEQLNETSPGVYMTDSTKFKPEIGRIYQLDITTPDGKNYQSSTCKMLPQTRMDELYFMKDKQWDTDNRKENEGVSIYLNGLGNEGSYVRWSFDESWKFSVPYPALYTFNDNHALEIASSPSVICWKGNKSNNILIHSFNDQQNLEIKEKQITFIPVGLSDRTSIRYSILAKQMSISKEEYLFWDKLKSSTEDIGDIFGKQPFSIKGNISNTSDAKEPVLGYFQVASVVTKRLYIDASEVFDLGLTEFYSENDCRIDTIKVDRKRYMTPYQIYHDLVLNGPYALYQPVYDDFMISILGLVLTSPKCADCSLTGNIKKPDFWKD